MGLVAVQSVVQCQCVNTYADSLWSLGKFECLIGMEGATEEQVALQALLDGDLGWPEECSAEFHAPAVGTGIPKCGRVTSSERITADAWSALEVMEGLKPVAGNTLGGVNALAHQGASLGAGGIPEKVKAAGSIQGGAAPEVSTRKVEWESMWDEVINGISDGRKLDTEDATKLVQLKEKAMKHAAVWQTHLGKQLASDRCSQQKYLRNTAPWVYTCLEAAELVGGKQQWPPLLGASIRNGTSNFIGKVELTHLQEYFKKTALPPEQVELTVTQVVKGQSLRFGE